METTLIVLGVFAKEDRWLVVEERDGSWYLPAGRVEPGEDLVRAMLRETQEEAGLAVTIEGLLGFDHEVRRFPREHARLRFVFAGRPLSEAQPKSVADRHTRGAAWLTREEIGARPLRHPEVLRWIDRRAASLPLLPVVAYEWLR